MYIDGTQPTKSDTFNDGVDCEARLGKGGIVGLFFVIIVLLTTLYIIAMLSSAKNPVFGDKQIVVNQEWNSTLSLNTDCTRMSSKF